MSEWGRGNLTNTDAAGLFIFPANPRAHSVAAVSAAGYANLRVHRSKDPVAIQLQPWGRVEGTVAVSARSQSVDSVVLMDDKAMQYNGAVRFGSAFHVKPDSSGSFVFENVPPGRFSVYVSRGVGIPFCHRTAVTVRPGETITVEIGGRGRTVIGQLAAASGQITDWVKQVQFAAIQQPTPPSAAIQQSAPPSNLTGDAAALWKVDFWQSDAASEQNRRNESFGVVVAADGSFRAEGVEPGTYTLQIFAGGLSIRKKLTIPEDSTGTSGDYDLGTFALPEKRTTQ